MQPMPETTRDGQLSLRTEDVLNKKLLDFQT